MESFLSGREEWMGRGRSLYQEYSWWGKCWLLTCLGETDKGRVCERWPGRPPGLTPGGVFPGVGTGGRVDEGRGPGAQYISLTLFQHNKCSTFLRSNRPLPETIMMSLSGVSEMYWGLPQPWKALYWKKTGTCSELIQRILPTGTLLC